MATSTQKFKLNTGADIPGLGLGTWQSKPGEVREAVQHALEIGYRHVDAAYCYGNEAEVGEGIRQAILSGKVRREDIFVTTKLWCTYHTKVEENLDLSLKALGLDYVDLYLMHWPIAMNPKGEYAYKLPNPTAGFSCNNRLYCWFSQYLLNTLKTLGNDDKFPTRPDGSRDIVLERSHIDTYKDMEKLIALGKARAIGVANYSLRFLKELLPSVSVVPAVNQIENHPQLPQQEIVDYCELHGIHITAYSPLGSTGSPLIKLPVIQSIAQKKSTTPAVVLLSWHVSSGRSVLAKSVTASRIEENLTLVSLDEKELHEVRETILSMEQTNGVCRYVYPAFGVDFGFPDKS